MAVSRHQEYQYLTCDYNHYVLPDSDLQDATFDSDNMDNHDLLNHELSMIGDYDDLTKALTTPPLSPNREDEPVPRKLPYGGIMPTSEMFDSEFRSKVLLQDCMWSGIEKEDNNTENQSRRKRNVSLSELNMVTTSTSCVDPTTFTAYPRQQNQVEHNYSLVTPEPMRVPKLHGDVTPITTDDSESEEDVIDVVTVDTGSTQSSIKSYIKHKGGGTAVYRVKHDLRAAAQQLLNQSHKRPKCMDDDDFAHPSKKPKRYLSSQNSLVSSHSGSDNEEFEGKRSAHNVMERQRRNELKNSLHGLRDSLPSLETQERAPKVVILGHAAAYIKELQSEDRRLTEDHAKVKIRNTQLKERMAYLRACTDML